MKERGPDRARGLNARFSMSETVWDVLGGVAMLLDMHQGEEGLDFQKSILDLVSCCLHAATHWDESSHLLQND